jgi:hypothetical protein
MIHNFEPRQPGTFEFSRFYFRKGDLDNQEAPTNAEKSYEEVCTSRWSGGNVIKFHFVGHEDEGENNIFPTFHILINPAATHHFLSPQQQPSSIYNIFNSGNPEFQDQQQRRTGTIVVRSHPRLGLPVFLFLQSWYLAVYLY